MKDYELEAYEDQMYIQSDAMEDYELELQKEYELKIQKETLNMLSKVEKAINNSQISGYEIKSERKNNIQSITIKIDNIDKTERFINTKVETPILKTETSMTIKKGSFDERKSTIERLHNEGLTQVQIAEKTMLSQKTISNDLKKIKNNQ